MKSKSTHWHKDILKRDKIFSSSYPYSPRIEVVVNKSWNQYCEHKHFFYSRTDKVRRFRLSFEYVINLLIWQLIYIYSSMMLCIHEMDSKLPNTVFRWSIYIFSFKKKTSKTRSMLSRFCSSKLLDGGTLTISMFCQTRTVHFFLFIVNQWGLQRLHAITVNSSAESTSTQMHSRE